MGVALNLSPDVEPTKASFRRFLWLVPLIALFVVAGAALFKVRQSAQVGKPAPEISLPSLDDASQTITLSHLIGREGAPGKPLVLNFWASWCDPCKEEAPEFATVSEQTADQVTFLGVNILDGINAGKLFVADFELPYESVRDDRGVTARAFKVSGAPETFFIDAEGRIVGRYIGALKPGQLGALVQQLITLPRGQNLQITGRGDNRPLL